MYDLLYTQPMTSIKNYIYQIHTITTHNLILKSIPKRLTLYTVASVNSKNLHRTNTVNTVNKLIHYKLLSTSYTNLYMNV